MISVLEKRRASICFKRFEKIYDLKSFGIPKLVPSWNFMEPLADLLSQCPTNIITDLWNLAEFNKFVS